LSTAIRRLIGRDRVSADLEWPASFPRGCVDNIKLPHSHVISKENKTVGGLPLRGALIPPNHDESFCCWICCRCAKRMSPESTQGRCLPHFRAWQRSYRQLAERKEVSRSYFMPGLVYGASSRRTKITRPE